jgi:sterol desaturase/sphingolipid hydroxylase (fatty acid hydroxylase superfamily)
MGMWINVYAVVTPVVLALVAAELLYCWRKKNGYYAFQDSIASLGTAVINQCVNVAVAFAILPLFERLGRFALFEIDGRSPVAMAGLFLGVDFLFYWFHRFGHRTNIGWAAHSPHHSTEELNYAVALRASVTQRLFSFLFYWPLVLVGFAPADVLAVVAVHLVLQFIPHTRVIPVLPPWIESWLNTPSHHRVHHARNDRYLDKNYGGFLIVWDRMFGTYEPEVEPCSYGLTAPLRTWDPTIINFREWSRLFGDALRTKHVLDKVRIWIMPTGWRPSDLPPRRYDAWHVEGVERKFRSVELPRARGYLSFQVVTAMPFMLLVSHHASPLSSGGKILLTGLLWIGATAWAGMLESKPWAIPLERARVAATACAVGLFLYAHGEAAVSAVPVIWGLASLAWLVPIRPSDRLGVAEAS